MAVPRSAFLCLLLLLFLTAFSAFCSPSSTPEDSSIDLDFDELEALDIEDSWDTPSPSLEENVPFDDFDSDGFSAFDDEEAFGPPVLDPDVVVLAGKNFSDFIGSNRYVMVEFYAPWCGHCKALAPEYAAAATKLKQEEHRVHLAKVDATVEFELAQKFEVQGYPTLFFFVDGMRNPYTSHRTEDAIVGWVKRKLGPAVTELTTIHDAETVLQTGNPMALAFFDKFEGPEVEEYNSAARQDDALFFYQTKNEDVAEIFHIRRGAKTPSLVLLKNLPEKISHYEGKFKGEDILEFILANKLPLVTTFSRDTASEIFESPIKRQIILFVNSEDKTKVLPIFEESAKLFKGKIIFVHVDSNDDDVGKPLLGFFGIVGDKPMIVGFIVVDGEPRKYSFEDKLTVEAVKAFGEDFLANKLKEFYKSAAIPEKNDEDVKIVVGRNFDEIVLDESKDVLLEMYAPWCRLCQAFELTYNKLGRVFRSVGSVVIAKMDGTANEHCHAKADQFPTLLFFPAGNKIPIAVDTDMTLKALYQFLKKNVAIPFTLPKLNKTEAANVKSVGEGLDSSSQLKDEL